MKKCLLCLLITSFCLNAQPEVQALIMQSPAFFVDREAVAVAAQKWAEQYGAQLNEAELKVVMRALHLGKVFSGVDLKMRTLVQSMLTTMCSLYKVITSGNVDLRLSQEFEMHVQEFSKLKGMHSFMFNEWQAWTNVLSVSDNQHIIEAIEAVNEAVRCEIERALGQKEWQVLASRVPSSAQKTIETLTLLTSLCKTNSQKNKVNEQQEQVAPSTDPLLLFDVVVRAAENSCEHSFEVIETASQLLRYETLLLEISYIMFDAYLETMQQSLPENEYHA